MITFLAALNYVVISEIIRRVIALHDMKVLYKNSPILLPLTSRETQLYRSLLGLVQVKNWGFASHQETVLEKTDALHWARFLY